MDKFLGFLVLVFTLSASTLVWSVQANNNHSPTNNEYINIAGQQRLLVHQMLVAYIQIGQGQSFFNPVSARVMAVEHFEHNFQILSSNTYLASPIQKAGEIWEQLKPLVKADPDKEKLPDMVKMAEQITRLSDKMIAILSDEQYSELDIVNASGRLRMLSQSIAMYMLMENWQVGDQNLAHIKDALSQYEKGLKHLRGYKGNSRKITLTLKSMKRDLKKLKKLVKRWKKNRDFSYSISCLTGQLLRKAKNTTARYVRLLDKVSVQQSVSSR